MKLLIAIVQDKYVNGMIKEFLNADIRITKLTSTGGFLKDGNTTFLIGVDVEDLNKAKNIIANIIDEDPMVSEGPEDVQIHGAHIFVVDVAEFLSV